MLDSRSLRYFVCLARELHFGRAAEHVHIAQSALSRHIKDLEARLGARLLNRGRRSAVTLTEAGKALLVESELAFQQLERAATAVGRASRGEVGRVEVGYVVSAALTGVLPLALAHFRASRPDVQVQLTALETPKQLAALADGLLDVGFIRPRASYPGGVEARVIHRESVLLALAADHPLAGRTVTLADLAQENFIIPQFDESAGFAEQLAALASRGGFEPKLTHRVRDFVTAVTLAAAGYGIVPIPKSMALIGMPNLVCKPIAGYDDLVELAVAYRPASAAPAAKALIHVTCGVHSPLSPMPAATDTASHTRRRTRSPTKAR